MIAETWDVMTYREGMDELDPTTLNTVLDAVKAYDPDSYTSADVERALANDECSLEDFKALLSPAAEPYIEEMAQKAQAITRARLATASPSSHRCTSPIIATTAASTAVSTAPIRSSAAPFPTTIL